MRALNEGLKFLKSKQLRGGSFLTYSSKSKKDFKKAIKFHSVFTSALILQNLSSIDSIKEVKKDLADFLLSQKSKHYSYNYWVRGSVEERSVPYPDDLDDTFCALSALFLYNPKLITGKLLSSVVSILASTEVKVGGPYKTWLVDKSLDKVWQDVDPVVNINVAYFLSLLDIKLPKLDSYISNLLTEDKLVSPYYPSELPGIYFLSRFIKDKQLKIILVKKLQDRLSDRLNSLELALLITSLINLRIYPKKLDQLVSRLSTTQQRSGGWKAYPFYTGVNPKKDRTYFAGSEALTTSFCIQAINLYKKFQLKPKNEVDLDWLISGVAKQLPKTKVLKKEILTQASTLPFYFAQSLGDHNIPKKFFTDLGVATCLGWISYTIYDDFFDGEGQRNQLSLANGSLRGLTRIFSTILPGNSGFLDIFSQIMDKLDEANYWEVKNCHISGGYLKVPDYKDYKHLAYKSYGHMLGPLAVLCYLGFKKDSQEIKSTIKFFTNYLIARQLNDDAHDWKEDLKSGYINPVAALTFKNLKVKVVKFDDLDYKNLQLIFWRDVVGEVSDLVLLHVKKAKKSLKDPVFKNPKLLEEMVEKFERIAEKTKLEQSRMLELLELSLKPESTKEVR